MKCLSCKTGNLERSGCHAYCDKCSFSMFVVTDDYLESCASMLGTIISNTKFDTEQDVGHFIWQAITEHLPRLHAYIKTITSDITPLIDGIVNNATAQAINLVIGNTVIGEQAGEKSLVCNCGCTDFHLVTQARLTCKQCEAEFTYNEESGLYEPYFLCECGSYKYEKVDGSIGLVMCTECNEAYGHNEVDGVFNAFSK